MKKLRKTICRSLIVFGIALLSVSCANNPTVPLPPPDVTAISTTSPDLDGFVKVTGAPEAVQPDSVHPRRVILIPEAHRT